ncbi:hypothetical protein NHP194022_08260 [Helicobacter suis]|nr:hypothetical protein NHP194022_08260 [Helicobacter suis]
MCDLKAMKKIVINVSVIRGKLTGLGVYALTFARTLEKHFKNTDVSVTFYANECFYTDLNAWLNISLAPPFSKSLPAFIRLCQSYFGHEALFILKV